MPDRTPAPSYRGPERRSKTRRVEDRPPVRHGWFSAWQWAVVIAFAAFFVSIVLSAVTARLAHNADENARRGNTAICVQVAFLENSVKTTEMLVKQNPTDSANPARVAGSRNVRSLIAQLQREIPSCTEALR